MTEAFDVLILGGGAAGLMCAIEAGKHGRRVALLEHADRCGKKILISGGGRCNFTNIHCRPENFLSSNPHFARSALTRYTPQDFLGLVEKHRIPYHEKALGQLFCDRSSRDILQMLEEECRDAVVRIVCGASIGEVTKAVGFSVRTSQGEFQGKALVIATGGLSIPKMGATGFGYDVARQFGLKIREPRAALVPLLLSPPDRESYCDLSGVSAAVIASCDGVQFREKMLITHHGLSGPAILQVSSYWKPGAAIRIDLAPDQNLEFGKGPRSLVNLKKALHGILPQRLASRWAEVNAPARFTNAALADFDRRVHAWDIIPAGTEGYAKAEVTAGGVDTDELSPQTMEARKVPGLFFIGEVVDVTGHLGGFNFQWAWASGAAAGRAV